MPTAPQTPRRGGAALERLSAHRRQPEQRPAGRHRPADADPAARQRQRSAAPTCSSERLAERGAGPARPGDDARGRRRRLRAASPWPPLQRYRCALPAFEAQNFLAMPRLPGLGHLPAAAPGGSLMTTDPANDSPAPACWWSATHARPLLVRRRRPHLARRRRCRWCASTARRPWRRGQRGAQREDAGRTALLTVVGDDEPAARWREAAELAWRRRQPR